MHGIGLIKRATVDADAEIGADGMAEPGLCPQQDQPHDAGEKRGHSEGNRERQQQLAGLAEAEDLNERLCERVIEYPFRCGEHTQKRQHRTNADDLGKGREDHHDKQDAELHAPPWVDVGPQAAEKDC